MRVAKWGNSLAIRLPAAVVAALVLREGDEIDVQVSGARDFDIARKLSREEALRRIRQYRGTFPADFRFDRDEANAR